MDASSPRIDGTSIHIANAVPPGQRLEVEEGIFQIQNGNGSDAGQSAATLSATISSYFETERDDFMVNSLLQASDTFLSYAHGSVIKTNSIDGQQEYFQMIKLSIQSLLMLVKNYRQLLNPTLESMVYFKLAKIYFSETEIISRADDYINKAISISTRNNLYKIKFISEFLAAQIIQKSTTTMTSNSTDSLLSKYLDERMSTFKSLGLNVYVNLFQLLKISNLMVVDHSTGLVVLQSLCNDTTVDTGVKLLCLVYQSSMHLYRGSPEQALSILDNVHNILFAPDANYSIQLKAMYYLQLHLTYIQIANLKESKKVMQEISKLLLSEQENGWQSWKEDGYFEILQSIEGVSTTVPYQVSWMNSDEFVIMFYFLSGVNMIYEAHNGKNKSMRVFKKCLDIIEKQLQQLTGMSVLSERNFSIKDLTKKKIKLRYLQYSINYYQVLSNISSTPSSELQPSSNWSHELDDFLSKLKSNKFSSEELHYFQQFIPNVYYLFAIYNQFQGKLATAKQYFIKVLELKSERRSKQNFKISLAQFELGIGCNSLEGVGIFSEVYVYSLKHLLIILEYEVSLKDSIIDEETHKLRNYVYGELASAFSDQISTTSNSFNINFVKSLPHLQILYQVILSIYKQTTSMGTFESCNFQNIDWESFSRNFPIIGGLASYISWVNSSDIDRRNKYYTNFHDITNKVSETSIDGKILKIFLLRSMIEKSRSIGEEIEKISLLELQLASLVQQIQSRLESHQ
ncbi:hypothetical protein CLIB1423_06S04830 [[Candida] railenensis]|uniref:Uncharacterized protein n=1 Tax=[Candida] railenensis TaxID=45579 RepID=A0A9P0QPJ0_9ASCO|nr:hypothetical protein CLIB1423_06S04830 [[Candida] railenensis]